VNEPKSRTSKLNLLAYGVLVFVVVFVTLAVVQAAGLSEYGGFAAGVLGALAAMLGSVVFLKRRTAMT